MLNVSSLVGFRERRRRSRRSPRERERVFTAYVRELKAAEEDSGEADAGEAGSRPPAEALFDRVWKRLAGALAAELRRRGLWDQPPRFLGVAGGGSWDQLALEELVAEAYSYNFVDRLRSLQAQLEVKPNVDGLVIRNLRQMLNLRLRRHDPVGYRVYQLLQGAVREEVEDGELHVISGDPRVRNDTVLAFDPAGGDAPGPTDSPEVFDRLARRWSDQLLPELVTARGPARRAVTDRLRDRLPELRRRGLTPFRFRSLLDPLKSDVRARWAALQLQEQGETAVEIPPAAEAANGDKSLVRWVRLVRPRPEIEERQAFRELAGCVDRHLAALDPGDSTREARTRTYLRTLWTFLARHAVSDQAELPSQRELSRELDIPRERLPGLFERLGEMIEACQAELAGSGGARPEGPGRERSEP